MLYFTPDDSETLIFPLTEQALAAIAQVHINSAETQQKP